MSLYTKITGRGMELVLLHGWGMNADVWEDVIDDLSKTCRVTAIDLPGHGRSKEDLVDYSLENIARVVMEVVPQDSNLVGWSLGGLVATQMVLDYPDQFKKLVLVASSPQFIKDDSWPDGMDADVLDGFAGDMRSDFRKTMKRFIAIQTMGSDNAREESSILRDRVFRHGHPRLSALQGGLTILHNTNLRPRLNEIKCPTLLIAGEGDTLFRPGAAKRTQGLMKNAKLCTISGAGHAPFLSHRSEFISEIIDFLNNE